MAGARKHVFSGSIYEDMAGYAREVIVDDRIFVSGTVGVDFSTGEMADGPKTQAHTVLDTIERALKEVDSGLHDVVRARVYVPDPVNVSAISAVLKDRIGFTRPTNTTICALLAVPEAT